MPFVPLIIIALLSVWVFTKLVDTTDRLEEEKKRGQELRKQLENKQ